MSDDIKIDIDQWRGNALLNKYTILQDIETDKNIRKIHGKLDRIRTLQGFEYKNIQDDFDDFVDLILTMSKYIEGTLRDIDYLIDQPFYDRLNHPDGVLERLEHTNISRYETENTLGLKQEITVVDPETRLEVSLGYKNQTKKLTLEQLMNGEYGGVNDRLNSVKEHYKEKYDKIKGELPDNTSYEDYVKSIIANSDVHHTVDAGFIKNTVSDILDIVGITSLVKATTGKNPFTGELCTPQERESAKINTVVTAATYLIPFGIAVKGGVKGAIQIGGKQIVISLVSGGSGVVVKNVSQELGAPPEVAAILGIVTSVAVGQGLNQQKYSPEPNSKNPMFGQDWDDYFRDKYGDENVKWLTKSGKNPYFVPKPKVIIENTIFDFATDYDTHMIQGNGTVNTNRSRAGVNGAHNEQYFTRYLEDNGGRILSKTEHPTIKGVYEIKYEVYSSSMNNGQGGYRKVFTPKTVYDPNIISDQQMIAWGKEAMANGSYVGGRKINGKTSNGLEFTGIYDSETNTITNFYPRIPLE